MQKILISLSAILMMLSFTAHAQDVTVKVNGSVLEPPVPAQIVNDRTMLPMRSIFERLGAQVTWLEEDRIIVATKDKSLIVMQIDNTKMSVQNILSDEVTEILLDSPPFIQNDSTMVPVRAVAETLGAKVEWDPETYTVTISTVFYEDNPQ